jgi:hypothetical protein
MVGVDFRSLDFCLQAPGARKARGSVYLHVLASSLLISVIGLGALSAVRVQMRSARLDRDCAQARLCAVSAVELGLLHVRQDPQWRQTWSSGVWMQDQPLGSGRFTLEGVDPRDNVLDSSPYDPLVLTGTGTAGIARHKARVTLVPVIQPLEALNTCLHASGQIHVMPSKTITVVGAPLSTNGQLTNTGTIHGNAEVQNIVASGTITGTLTAPAPAKPLPDASTLAWYVARATTVPYASTVEKAVLTPGYNPLGPTDPNGLYIIDTSGRDLTIKNLRVHGTLVVLAANKTVIVDDAVFLQNYRSDFPVLLVHGNLVLKYKSAEGPLSEATCGTNFNPVGAPYEGVWDEDMDDAYPNEIHGLIHVMGSLILEQTARVVGAVICEGDITCAEANTIVHDLSLYACPPLGYTFVERTAITPNSWRQVVD